MWQAETHTFTLANGKTWDESIHVSVTHLAVIPCDHDERTEPGHPDCLMIRAWSREEAEDIIRCHRCGEIWERLPSRSFAPA